MSYLLGENNTPFGFIFIFSNEINYCVGVKSLMHVFKTEVTDVFK